MEMWYMYADFLIELRKIEKKMRKRIESMDNHQTRHKLNIYMYCYICTDTFDIVGV